MADWPMIGDGQRTVYGNSVPDATVGGTVVFNSSGVTHTKSAYSVIMSAASNTTGGSGIFVDLVANLGTVRAFIDIAIGNAGSEFVIIPNIYFSPTKTLYAGWTAYFPITIPPNTPISARLQSTTVISSSSRLGVSIRLQDVGELPATARSIVQAIGDQSATTEGSRIKLGDPLQTTPHLLSDWTTFSHTLFGAADRSVYPIEEIILYFGTNDVSWVNTRRAVDIGIAATSELTPDYILIEQLPLVAHANPDQYEMPWFGPYPCHIPAGSSIFMRCRSELGFDNVLATAMLYGVS